MDHLWTEDVLGDKRRAEDAKAAAIQFEAVKSHMRQSATGVAITLNLNPHDVPAEITQALIGQRFLCVLVPIDQNEQPIVSTERRDAEDWIRNCGIMCSDNDFRQWVMDQGLAPAMDGETVADAVRDFCGVSSRAQFRDKPEALKKWKQMHKTYLEGGKL